jgi:hypothetical protein
MKQRRKQCPASRMMAALFLIAIGLAVETSLINADEPATTINSPVATDTQTPAAPGDLVSTIEIDIEVWEADGENGIELFALDRERLDAEYARILLISPEDQQSHRGRVISRSTATARDGRPLQLTIPIPDREPTATTNSTADSQTLTMSLTPRLTGLETMRVEYQFVRGGAQGEAHVSGTYEHRLGTLMQLRIAPRVSDNPSAARGNWLVFLYPRKSSTKTSEHVIDANTIASSTQGAFIPRPGRFERRINPGWSGLMLVATNNPFGGVKLTGNTNIGAGTARTDSFPLSQFSAKQPVLEVVESDDGFIRLAARREGIASLTCTLPGLDGKPAEFEIRFIVVADTSEIDRAIKELVPLAKVKVTKIKDAALLTGIAPTSKDLSLLMEIARQFYPEVINHLEVDEGESSTKVDEPAGVALQNHNPDSDPEPPQAKASVPRSPRSTQAPSPVPETNSDRSPVPQTDSRKKELRELKALRHDVRQLRDNVRRLAELIEHRPTKVPDPVSNQPARESAITDTRPTNAAGLEGDKLASPDLQPTGSSRGLNELDRTISLNVGDASALRFERPLSAVQCTNDDIAGIEVVSSHVIRIHPKQAGVATIEAWHRGADVPERIQIQVVNDRCASGLKKLVRLNFDETPLLAAIQEVSRLTDINVVIDESGLAEQGVAKSTPINLLVSDITARSALQLMLNPLGLAFLHDHEVITITSLERAKGDFKVCTYPVIDLLNQETNTAPDASSSPSSPAARTDRQIEESSARLSKVIQKAVDPDSWETVGGAATIEFFKASDSLVVRQTQQHSFAP